MVSFSLPKIREVQKHRKKIPLPDGLQILIVYHWDFATIISVVLLKHGPSSFPTPPQTKISTNPWNFLGPNLPPMGGASAITVNGFCQLSSCSKTTPWSRTHAKGKEGDPGMKGFREGKKWQVSSASSSLGVLRSKYLSNLLYR